jgi:DNA-binding response OmpR family regulator
MFDANRKSAKPANPGRSGEAAEEVHFRRSIELDCATESECRRKREWKESRAMTMKVFPLFRLDEISQYLWRSAEDGAEERITRKPKTYSILTYFLDHPGRLVTQEELLESVCCDTYVQPEVVKRHIFDLRRAQRSRRRVVRTGFCPNRDPVQYELNDHFSGTSICTLKRQT